MSRISQCDLVGGILRVLLKLSPGLNAEPRIVNTVIEAANSILKEIEREPVLATPNMGLSAWLQSDDTGLSSRFMAHILVHGPRADMHYPSDPSDFGRCYRFLLAVPKAVNNMARLEKCGEVWAAYVKQWGVMEKLWLEEMPSGSCPKLYELMKQIQATHARRAKS